MNLIDVQNIFKANFDIEHLKAQTVQCFWNLIENPENIELKLELEVELGELLEKGETSIVFSHININILSNFHKNPYIRVYLDIIHVKKNIKIAWYCLEYGCDGNIQDDYFDFGI